MDNKRKEWIRGVAEMLSKLTVHPELPVPNLHSGSTFIGMVIEVYDPGVLLRRLIHVTNQLDGATLEFYNWTEDKLPDMDRVRLVWMFGPIRYELDAGVHEVWGKDEPPNPNVFTNVNFIGENINTIMRPESS